MRNKNTKIIDIIGKVSLSILSLLISYKIIYYVSEYFFFDKFFYQKSIEHGYFKDVNNDLEKYGDRSKDIIWLLNRMKNIETYPHNDSDSYNIAVIGDSVVWGQGVKNNERFPVILERELNKIRKTKVYSYALVGDNFSQNYEKIKFLESLPNNKIDLYILAIVHNDAFVTISDRYPNKDSKPLMDTCSKVFKFVQSDYVDPKTPHEIYKQMTQDALNSKGNNCLINKIIENLPKNLIVFETDNNYPTDSLHDMYVEIFSKYNRRVISPLANLILPIDPNHLFFKMIVSNIDGHPSYFANKAFAKTLFTEITNNVSYNFRPQK